MNRLISILLLCVCCITTTNSAVAAKITIGSKNFGENYLLAEIVSQMLEAKGHLVDRRFGLGGTLVCYEALVSGEIDAYVEYTGTLEQVILKGANLRPTVAGLNERIDPALLVLDSLGFNNTYAITLKEELANTRSIETISDLAEHTDLTVAVSLEFLNREDGWPGLAEVYELDHQPIGIDHGLAYQAIDDHKIDITDAYSTDGDLQRYELISLQDDKNYFPEYFATPLVRKALPKDVIATIGVLSGMLDDEKMRALNAEVVVQGRSFAEVAQSYLDEVGIVDSSLRQLPSESLLDSILANTLVHLKLTGIALLLGCIVGLPLGVIAYRNKRLARITVYVAGLLQTVPSIALLALMIPLFGIGQVPAIIALFLYSILPILRNTITGLVTIDPVLKRVADAIGLTQGQQLRLVLIPMALPTILAGVKTAAVISIGTATLAAFIGAGGLGEPIVTGLALNDSRLILQGAIPAAILAICVELMFEGLERLIVRPHMLHGQLPD
jgi:osmoprotectant transport system permease protein